MKSKITLLLLSVLQFGFVSNAFAVAQASIPPKLKGVILSAPEPEYSQFRGGHQTYIEQGVYRLNVNPKTGAVDEVNVVRHCQNRRLDALAVMAFFQWKFKPGAVKAIDVPVRFDRFVSVRLEDAVTR